MIDESKDSFQKERKLFDESPDKYIDDYLEGVRQERVAQRKKSLDLLADILGVDRAVRETYHNRDHANVISLDEARERKRAQHFQFTQAYSDKLTQRAVGGARRLDLAEEDMGWFVDPKSFRCVVPDEDLYSIIVKGFGEDVLGGLRESDAEAFSSKLIFFFDGIPMEPYNVKLDPKGQRFLIEFFLFEDDQETFDLDRFESNIEDDGRIRIQLWTK